MNGEAMSLTWNVLLAAVPEAGGYVSTAKVIVMLVLTMPWLWACAWVDKDARMLRMPQMIWTSLSLGCGVVGLLIWILVPMYPVGLGVFVVLVAAVVALYVMQRNARVPRAARVLTVEHLSAKLKHRKETVLKVQTRVKLYDHSGRPVLPPMEGGANEKNTYNLAQELLYDLIWRRASEALLGSSPSTTTPKYIIDGVVIAREPMERADAASIIDYLKGVAGMDVEDKRRPQTGKMAVDLAAHPIDINVTSAGSMSGQKIQFKIIQESVRTHLTELGMSDTTLKHILEINTRPKGLIIVSAPPHNGMTSTL
jgi:type II secretory ATPase GspE/PulE/Tfp pilus assembly ATPase PilB-like protein